MQKMHPRGGQKESTHHGIGRNFSLRFNIIASVLDANGTPRGCIAFLLPSFSANTFRLLKNADGPDVTLGFEKPD
jgi:hypothetical protein